MKNSPSCAIAYGTRAQTSEATCNALKTDSAKAAANRLAAAGPKMRVTTSVATGETRPEKALIASLLFTVTVYVPTRAGIL